jgi:hypothetical protein
VTGLLASLAGFHRGWAWVVIVGNAVAGLWALAAHRWRAWATKQLWWFTVAVELAVVAQVIMGVKLVAGRDTPDLHFHELYGFSTLVAVGILYSYRQQLRDRIYLLYGFGGLFLMGLGIRAWQVGAR